MKGNIELTWYGEARLLLFGDSGDGDGSEWVARAAEIAFAGILPPL